MANVTPHDLGISLGTSQVRAKVRRHLWIVERPPRVDVSFGFFCD
jgi:hypothetical protein